MPEYIETYENFQKVLSTHSIVVIDFTATWCGPCKKISPFFDSLEEKYTKVKFYKVDVDEGEEIAFECGINSMPTFKLYKNGKEVNSISGSNELKLESMISEV